MRRIASKNVLLLLSGLVFAGCNNPIAPAPPPAAVMLGEWTYSSAAVIRDPPSLNAGFRVTIAIDSLDGMRFRGRVVLWLGAEAGPFAAGGCFERTLHQS
jgi:hypothetical protein